MNPTSSATEKPGTILVVDDEKNLRDTLEFNLRREGYRMLSAADGTEGIRLAYAERPDLIILDVMLPGMSGFDVCRAVRKELTMPILMLSAREEEIDKVLGLELGADDYMAKPFGLRELLARVGAMLRRTRMMPSEVPAAPLAGPVSSSGEKSAQTLIIGDLEIDLARHMVVRAGQVLEINPRQFDLLHFLASHPGQVFSREVLLDRVWGYEFAGGTRTVDVHVRWLREKLEHDPARPQLIQTVHGVGYKFSLPQQDLASGEDSQS